MSIAVGIEPVVAVSIVATAASLGAQVVREPENRIYGERPGLLRDPFGDEWTVGHHIEDLSRGEMQRQYDAAGTAANAPGAVVSRHLNVRFSGAAR